jgi:hypothetical protein
MGELRPASEFYWDKYLTMGAYGIWEVLEDEAIEGDGILPPIGYKDGEAL